MPNDPKVDDVIDDQAPSEQADPPRSEPDAAGASSRPSADPTPTRGTRSPSRRKAPREPRPPRSRDGRREAGDDVRVGRIVKPHGIRGEVAVDVLTDLVQERFAPGLVVTGERDRVRYVVETARPHQGRMLVKFEQVPDRNAAELLRGLVLLAPEIDTSDRDTYFVHELVGMPVYLAGEAEDGAEVDTIDLGEITAMIELPSQAEYDLLEVTRPDGRGTWLLPAVDEYVEVVLVPGEDGEDDQEVMLLIDPPGGLVPADLLGESGGSPVPPAGDADEPGPEAAP